jgi:hypothetical protein
MVKTKARIYFEIMALGFEGLTRPSGPTLLNLSANRPDGPAHIHTAHMVKTKARIYFKIMALGFEGLTRPSGPTLLNLSAKRPDGPAHTQHTHAQDTQINEAVSC